MEGSQLRYRYRLRNSGMCAAPTQVGCYLKLEPTSMARPAASAASMVAAEVIQLLPSGVGQSFRSMIRIGLTSHQIAPVLTESSSTTWLWFGVGTNNGRSPD